MSTTTLQPVALPRQAPTLIEIVQQLRPDQHLAVTEVTWEDYEQLLDWRDKGRRPVRITFDSGSMELVTHGNLHERYKSILGRVVSALCEELSVPMVLGGNCTIRREDLDRGFEPDDWFYLGSTATRMIEVTATRSLDFRSDPPPDLAIEIEITRGLLARLPLFAAVKIPELWRFDGSRFDIWSLQSNGEYTLAEYSRYFPTVTAAAINGCLFDLAALDDAARLRRFREWIRSQPPATPTPQTAPTTPNT
jgi:Uma2 family endonuclease